MYEVFFGLTRRPFLAAPRVDCYFPAPSIENGRKALIRCIQRGEGIAVVMGPSGTGKTLLCELVAESFRNQLQVVTLSSGRTGNRRALLQGILHGLGKPYRGMDEGELRLALVDHLTQPASSPRALLLLVDEAHTLPLRCMDELRMLTNVAAEGQPRTRLVLVGNSVLEERLASPKLDSLSQRVVVRCYLEALTQAETEGYIQAHLAWAGGQATELFSSEACQAVYKATNGVARLINQVCDHAMMLAFVSGQRRIDEARIQEAWADLQQLPTPWNGEENGSAAPKPSTEAIEFGTLEEEGDGAPALSGGKVESEGSGEGAAPATRRETPPPTPSHPAAQIDRIQHLLGHLEDDFRPAGTIRPEVEIVLDNPVDLLNEPFDEEERVEDRCGAQSASGAAGVSGLAASQQDRGVRASERSGPATLPLRPRFPADKLESGEPELVVEDDYDLFERPQPHPVVPVRKHQYGQLFTRLRHG